MATEFDVPVIPRCGLYRTTRPMPGHEQEIPAGRLVYFHNHSAPPRREEASLGDAPPRGMSMGPPIVLLPASNERNRWRFHRQGVVTADEDYLATLAPLKPEGFYRLREHFHPDQAQVVNRNALVQLGYTSAAEPILFFPMVHTTENSLVFPDRGVKIDDTIYALLEALDLRGPHTPDPPQLH